MRRGNGETESGTGGSEARNDGLYSIDGGSSGKISRGFSETKNPLTGVRLSEFENREVSKNWKPAMEECTDDFCPIPSLGKPLHFFDPVDKFNERWLHAREKPNSFRPSDKYPSFDQVMYEQYQLFKKHPRTTFINAHFGWYGNDLAKLSEQLAELPNVYVEFGAVINELGRQPNTARRFFEDYQDRILFGKDIYKMDEYYIYFQVLETDDEYIEYYRKRHGLWRLYGMKLSDEILKKGKKINFKSNNAGGILGGISSGQNIIASFAVKPTSSILNSRETVDKKGKNTKISVRGRHDPCVGIRAVPIGEAMLSCVLLDHFLMDRAQCG